MLKIGLIVAAVAVNFIPGVGQAISATIGAALAQTAVTAITSLGITSAFGIASKALGLGPKAPKINPASIDRLHASIDPGTARKVAFGRTALATDIRYQAFTGTDQEYYWQIVCVASHKVEAIEQLWLDDKLAWSSGGIGSDFTGYLQVTAITEGSSANVQNIDSNWGSSANTRLTGCAYLAIRYKLTGNSKKTESPFASSIPSRMTVVGKAMRVYDPRLDTTVGGSGSHRADDQSTWEYTHSGTDIGRNPALQMLTWLLGWKINGKLAVGRGVPPARIDLDSFITAANLCAESVSLSAGGTEPRYRFDGIFAEDEDGGSVLTAFNASMAGVLRDNGGKLALSVLHDDLSSPVMTLTEADVIGPFDWQQTQPLDQHRNLVRGKYTDPSNNSLYQLVDYPAASITAPDGIDRILTIDLPGVQSVTQAQRLAKQALQRIQYGGVLTCTLNAKAWGLLIGDVVEWDTFTPLGWTNKLMRLVERTIRPDGVSDCVFADEDAAIYAWNSGDEQTPVTPAAPIEYDWTKSPWQQANIEDEAEVSMEITGPASSEVLYDYDGTVKANQLPKTLTFKLLRSGSATDVTASATWGVTVVKGTGTAAPNATAGKIDVSAISTDEIELDVTATLGGRARHFTHKVTKKPDQAPVAGSSGSGGTSASDPSIAPTTLATYSPVNAGILRVTAGAAGQVSCSFPGSFTRGTNGIGTAFGKWQWRAIGGSFADIGSEAASTVSSFTNVADGTYDAGSIAVNQTKTGLTPGTDYEFALLLRNGGAYTQNWSGTAVAAGS